MKTQVQECSIKNDFSPLYVISLSPVEDSRVATIQDFFSNFRIKWQFSMSKIIRNFLIFLFIEELI